METKKKSRAHIIKSALSKDYGFKNVSVTRGRGTASGWIDVTIKLMTQVKPYRRTYEDLGERGILKERVRVEEKIIAALAAEGLALSTYYSDDGFGGARYCLLVYFK